MTLVAIEAPEPKDIEGTVLGRGYRVANGQTVALNSLAWSMMDDGHLRAATDIVVPGAKGLRLALSPSTLPPGIELRLRGISDTDLDFGPYTHEQILSERIGLFPPGGDGPYWLPIVDGETVRLDLLASTDANIQSAALAFPVVTVLDEPFETALDKARRRADPPAASCKIDVSCADTPISSAVAMLWVTDEGGFLFHPRCTGTLLNDTNGTGEPWLVTSTECINYNTQANNAIFSWFERTDACGSGQIDARWSLTYGATLLASEPEQGVAFLHLSGPLPTTARAGWTTDVQPAGQSVFSISYDATTYPVHQSIGFGSIGSVGDPHYSVYWNDGLSGVSLFNDSDQLIGLLHHTNASCKAPHLADEYVRFDRVYPLLEPWLVTETWNGTKLPGGSIVNLSGRVTDFGYTGLIDYHEPNPHCALVLINGVFDFSCDGDGQYEITAPLDASGKATLMVFAQGHRPYRRVLFPQNTELSFDVALSSVSENAEKPRLTRLTLLNVPASPTDWVHFSGRVENIAHQPLCALALANGQHVFSCDDPGEFELTVPRDADGNITLFLFADNLTPYRYTFNPQEDPLPLFSQGLGGR